MTWTSLTRNNFIDTQLSHLQTGLDEIPPLDFTTVETYLIKATGTVDRRCDGADCVPVFNTEDGIRLIIPSNGFQSKRHFVIFIKNIFEIHRPVDIQG